MKNGEKRFPKLSRLLARTKSDMPKNAIQPKDVELSFKKKVSPRDHLSLIGNRAAMDPRKAQRSLSLISSNRSTIHMAQHFNSAKKPLTDSEKVIKQILSIYSVDDEVRTKPKTPLLIKKRHNYGPGLNGGSNLFYLAGLSSAKSSDQKDLLLVNSIEDFQNVLKKRVTKINKFAGRYSLDPKLRFKIDLKYVTSNYTKMERWIDDNALSANKPKLLWHLAQLYPALTDEKKPNEKTKNANNDINKKEIKHYEVVRKISRIKETRVQKFKSRIEYLISNGIIDHDISKSNLFFWNEVLTEIDKWLSIFGKSGKWYYFQPQLFYFLKFLIEITDLNRGKLLYSLLNEFELLEDIYSNVYSDMDKHTDAKEEDVIGKLSRSISEMIKNKYLMMLLKYNISE